MPGILMIIPGAVTAVSMVVNQPKENWESPETPQTGDVPCARIGFQRSKTETPAARPSTTQLSNNRVL